MKWMVDSLIMTRDSNSYIWGSAPLLIRLNSAFTAFFPISSKGWARAVDHVGQFNPVCGQIIMAATIGGKWVVIRTLAIGIDELSVSHTSVLPLRAEIRKSIAKTCTLEKLEC